MSLTRLCVPHGQVSELQSPERCQQVAQGGPDKRVPALCGHLRAPSCSIGSTMTVDSGRDALMQGTKERLREVSDLPYISPQALGQAWVRTLRCGGRQASVSPPLHTHPCPGAVAAGGRLLRSLLSASGQTFKGTDFAERCRPRDGRHETPGERALFPWGRSLRLRAAELRSEVPFMPQWVLLALRDP